MSLVRAVLHFGVLIPNFGESCGFVADLVELAVEAEESGWDGFFLFDHIAHSGGTPLPIVDPWVALGAIAVKTKRIRLGPLATPVARRRPWKLARETLSVDHLSGGRLILGVGLGDPVDEDFRPFGEPTDDRVRAAKLDEGLDMIVKLWTGGRVNLQGRYWTARDVQFLPRSLQKPRIPIWVAGRWPRRAPFLRAALWDGVFPLGLQRGSTLQPSEFEEVSDFIKEHRKTTSPFDFIATSGADGHMEHHEGLRAYAEAGATWWMRDMRRWCDSRDELMTLIKSGPPRV